MGRLTAVSQATVGEHRYGRQEPALNFPGRGNVRVSAVIGKREDAGGQKGNEIAGGLMFQGGAVIENAFTSDPQEAGTSVRAAARLPSGSITTASTV